MARVARSVTVKLGGIGTRGATTAAARELDVDPEWMTAKPYEEIPGPKPLPIPKFGNAWRMIPPFGSYANMNMLEMNEQLIKDYGTILKLTGLGRADMVMVSEPEDVEKVFRNDSVWPRREGLECMDYYRRKTRMDVYAGNPGILSSQGEEWQRNRTKVNQPMMRPTNVRQYHDPIQLVAKEFVERIKGLRDDKLEMPKDFSNELNKWALESIALVALDARLGCLDGNLNPNSEAQIMINAVDTMFLMMYKLDFLPSLWKWVSTKDWRTFVNSMDTITNTCLKHINKKLDEIKSRPADDDVGHSMLETLLRNEGKPDTAITMAIDMMTAGIDTTSNSSAIALYYLSKNPEAQEKLFEEVKGIIPNKGDVLPTNYSSLMPYLKACVKESQRLTPIAAGNQRTIAKDLVLNGYQVPKGTEVVMFNMHMCHKDKHFDRPEEFIPERWLKSETGPLSAKNTNPFVFLPFGFGPRMCIGRRFAELEMHTLISMMIRNFKVSYEYGNMNWTATVLLSPKDPLRYKLEDRND